MAGGFKMVLHLEENSRNSTRHETIGLMSNITDGKTTYIAVVEDISATGLRISQVPAGFDDTVGRCYSIVNGPKNDFTVALIPRWAQVTNKGMYKMIGFEIENPPGSWTEFVAGVRENTDPFSLAPVEGAKAA